MRDVHKGEIKEIEEGLMCEATGLNYCHQWVHCQKLCVCCRSSVLPDWFNCTLAYVPSHGITGEGSSFIIQKKKKKKKKKEREREREREIYLTLFHELLATVWSLDAVWIAKFGSDSHWILI